MNTYIKRAMTAIALICLVPMIAGAQLKPGSLVEGTFDEDQKRYVAEVVTVNGETFTCRFLHSNSLYTMVVLPGVGNITVNATRFKAKVKTSKGGKFKADAVFHYHVATARSEPCNYGTFQSYVENLVIVKFDDGKSYLGEADKEGDICRVVFIHSGAVYEFRSDGTVSKSNGGYGKGRKATISCVDVSLNL